MPTTTTNLGLTKPDIGQTNWADEINGNLDLIDTAVDAKAPKASPALTGTPTAPTPSALDNSTKIATTAYVDTADELLKTDSYILSSAVDSSGNPNFLGKGSGATINVDGSTTPIVYFINGKRQVINSLLTVTPSTPASNDQLAHIFINKVSGLSPSSSDLVYTYGVVFCGYTTPNAPATNAYWFDLGTNTVKKSSSSGTGSWVVQTDCLYLGCAVISTSPTVRAVLSDPYRLTPYKRFQIFGDASNTAGWSTSTQLAITNQTIAELNSNPKYVGCVCASGSIVVAVGQSAQINNMGSIIFSQFPCIITNGAQWGQAGAGGSSGGAGTNAATGTAGGSGGCTGSGGGGGGGTANTGGAGGASHALTRTSVTSTGGTGGTAGNNGTNGNGMTTSSSPICKDNFAQLYHLFKGAGGGGGAGNASDKGGNGGIGGGCHVLVAPAILLDTGCVFTSDGQDGAAGGGTNSGGGGGGAGGIAIMAGGYVINNGTIRANGGAGGAKAGTGGNGGSGGAGIAKVIKLF